VNARPKRLPRLWCALQGLLPLESRFDGRRTELVSPRESARCDDEIAPSLKQRIRVATGEENMNVRARAALRNKK
jgi:hypothetical protein